MVGCCTAARASHCHDTTHGHPVTQAVPEYVLYVLHLLGLCSQGLGIAYCKTGSVRLCMNLAIRYHLARWKRAVRVQCGKQRAGVDRTVQA